jgi:hypothetical protein
MNKDILKIELQEGKNYVLKASRKTITFKTDPPDEEGFSNGLYDIVRSVPGHPATNAGCVTLKDIPGFMRMYAGYPKNYEGCVVTCIDDSEVIFNGGKKEKKKV